MDRVLNTAVSIYYPIYYGICLILHITLFILIYTKTTKVLSTMKYFLYPSNFANILLSSISFFVQVRTVNNKKSLALMCQGPCRLFETPYICFHSYVLLLTITTATGILNIHTLYYRLITIKYPGNTKLIHFKLLLFCLYYLFPLGVLVLSYIPPIDFNSVYLETLEVHPQYDFEPYGVFGGFANSHNICMTMVTLTLAFMTCYATAVGYYWRNQALKILDNCFKSLSMTSITQFRALIHGLGLQILLPLCCYVPVAVCFVYNKYSGTQILFSQYTLAIMATFPALLDPILQIYFIVPYRRAIIGIFRKNKPQSIVQTPNTITLIDQNRRKSSPPRIGVIQEL